MDVSLNKKILFFLALFMFITGLCCINSHPDNDLWARLIAGGHIVETLSIAKHDFLSYTPTHLWYDHEWGASVVFYFVLKHFGASGLLILKGILLSLTFLFCVLTVKERKPESTSPYNILFYVLMYFAVIKSTGAAIRCLLFTSMFFALCLWLLERSRNGKNKGLFWIPVIMAFWGNIHGGCLSILGVSLLYAAGEFLNGKEFKKYIIVAVASFAVLFINPYGIEYVKFLFEAGTMNRSYISEWLSPFAVCFKSDYIGYKIFFAVILSSLFFYVFKNKITYKKLDKTALLLIILMSYMSITHVRHISFFIFTVCTFLYNEFYFMLNSLSQTVIKTLKFADEKICSKLLLIKEIVVYCLIFLVSSAVLLWGQKQIKITDTEYPRFAIEFIKINNITGNLFINFDWGSYASYKLYPYNLIVMDGRYEEVYDPALLYDLRDFFTLKGDWYKVMEKYSADVMIIDKKYPVYKALENHPGWTAVFENNLSGVFVPSEKLRANYLLPPPGDDYYNKRIFDTDIKFKKAN